VQRFHGGSVGVEVARLKLNLQFVKPSILLVVVLVLVIENLKIKDEQENEDEKSPSPEKILHKRNQLGKFVGRVNVFFDDVKREIVKPAETPDGMGEQDGCPPIRITEEDQNCGDNSDEQEQQSFDLDPGWMGEVFHGKILLVIRPRPRNRKDKTEDDEII
jgi:hypothetical protein